MNAKHHYDRKHQPLFMKIDDYALLRLHRGYEIPSTARYESKYSQQYVDPFKILKRIGRLAYRLEIPSHWRIHPVFTVTQLKPVPPPTDDPFNRQRPDHPDSVFVEKNTQRVKSFEIERLINKRETAKRDSEYLIRWKGYDPQYDEWRNLPELKNAMNLVKKYEENIRTETYLPGRLKLPSADPPPKKLPAPPPKPTPPSKKKLPAPPPKKLSATPSNQVDLKKPSTPPAAKQSFAVIIPPKKAYPYPSTWYPFRQPNDKLDAKEAVAP